MSQADDLDTLAPAPTVARFKGRDVRITPLTVGQLPAFARAVRPFAGSFASVDGLTVDTVLGLVADHGEAFVEAVSIASRIPRGELSDAGVDDLIGLVAPVVKVNADFFGRLLRQYAPAFAGLTASGAGPTASPR